MTTPSPLRKTGHDRALAARAAKRAQADAIGLDEAFISSLVEAFYARIRADSLLGPVFASTITDWPAHLDRMKQFWRSVLHNSGEFSGNPMARHMALPGLEERHFRHWLALFYLTLRALDIGDAGRREVAERARMIADSLLTGIETRRHGLRGAKAGADLPHFD